MSKTGWSKSLVYGIANNPEHNIRSFVLTRDGSLHGKRLIHIGDFMAWIDRQADGALKLRESVKELAI